MKIPRRRHCGRRSPLPCPFACGRGLDADGRTDERIPVPRRRRRPESPRSKADSIPQEMCPPTRARDPNPCKFKTPFLRMSRCEALWSPAAAPVPPFNLEEGIFRPRSMSIIGDLMRGQKKRQRTKESARIGKSRHRRRSWQRRRLHIWRV